MMKLRLSDIADVTMGQSPKSEFYNSDGEGMPFLQGNRTFGKRYPVFDTYTTMPTKTAKAGDVIMSVRAPVGDLNFTPVDICLGRGVCGIRMKNGNQDFLFYLLKYYMPQLLNKESGTVFGSVNRNDINGLELEIPDEEKQRKIARVLTMLDKKIEENDAINENLLEQAQAILTSFFVDFSHFGGTAPNDWEQGTLQDIADFSNGYAFKSKELLDTPAPKCYHVFKQGHINRGGGFNSGGTKSWYPISKCASLSKYILHKGDVLMAMTDMKDNVAILGNTALMSVDSQYIVNQRVGLLRSNGYKNTSYAYIYLLTNSFDFLKDLRSRANSGVQVNLSSAEIKSSPVWIATGEVNKEFNSLTEPLLTMIMTNDIESQKLSDLRDTLLPRLMSGELDVSNLDL